MLLMLLICLSWGTSVTTPAPTVTATTLSELPCQSPPGVPTLTWASPWSATPGWVLPATNPGIALLIEQLRGTHRPLLLPGPGDRTPLPAVERRHPGECLARQGNNLLPSPPAPSETLRHLHARAEQWRPEFPTGVRGQHCPHHGQTERAPDSGGPLAHLQDRPVLSLLLQQLGPARLLPCWRGGLWLCDGALHQDWCPRHPDSGGGRQVCGSRARQCGGGHQGNLVVHLRRLEGRAAEHLATRQDHDDGQNYLVSHNSGNSEYIYWEEMGGIDWKVDDVKSNYYSI